MEEVLIHEASEERETSDKEKIEMTDSRKSNIRWGTLIFIGAILLCVFIILVPPG